MMVRPTSTSEIQSFFIHLFLLANATA
jgi:hypothetical protein